MGKTNILTEALGPILRERMSDVWAACESMAAHIRRLKNEREDIFNLLEDAGLLDEHGELDTDLDRARARLARREARDA